MKRNMTVLLLISGMLSACDAYTVDSRSTCEIRSDAVCSTRAACGGDDFDECRVFAVEQCEKTAAIKPYSQSDALACEAEHTDLTCEQWATWEIYTHAPCSLWRD